MQRHRFKYQFGSIFLSVLLLLTQAVFPYSAQTNIWKERKRHQFAQMPMDSMSLPPVFQPNLQQRKKPSLRNKGSQKKRDSLSLVTSLLHPFGSIRHINKGTSDNIILHLQDVHENFEAQKNLSAVVQNLIDHNQVDLVALEGTFGPINLEGFRSYPHKGVLKEVARFLLGEHRISGPIHSALTSSKEIPLVFGVDDPDLYEANVNAVREASLLKEATEEEWREAVQELAAKKKSLFSAPLLNFDQKVESYRKGEMPLSHYLPLLASQEADIPIETQSFLETLSLESRLNFDRVKAERTFLINQLVRKLSQDQISDLSQLTQAYRLGQIPHTAFYSHLKNLCKKGGVPLARYPVFQDYLQYVLLSDNINFEKVLTQTRELERVVYTKLVNTPKEKELVEQSRRLYLVGKLIDFALTKDEWEEYKRLTIDHSQLTNKDSLITSLNSQSSIVNCQLFYRLAEARDKAITQNLLAAIKTHNAKTAVLVTGGFHSKGIIHHLQKGDGGLRTTDHGLPVESVVRGAQSVANSFQSEVGALFSVVTFSPKITEIDSSEGSSYLSVFNQEKTPLEKLFEGEKLFLAKPPMPSHGVVAAHVHGLQQTVPHLRQSTPLEKQKSFDDMLGSPDPISVSVQSEADEEGFVVEFPVRPPHRVRLKGQVDRSTSQSDPQGIPTLVETKEELFNKEAPYDVVGTLTDFFLGDFFSYLIQKKKVSIRKVAVYIAPPLSGLIFHAGFIGLPQALPFFFLELGTISTLSSLFLTFIGFLISTFWYGSRLAHPSVYQVSGFGTDSYELRKAHNYDLEKLRERGGTDNLFYVAASLLFEYPLMDVLGPWSLLLTIGIGWLAATLSHGIRNWRILYGEYPDILGIMNTPGFEHTPFTDPYEPDYVWRSEPSPDVGSLIKETIDINEELQELIRFVKDKGRPLVFDASVERNAAFHLDGTSELQAEFADLEAHDIVIFFSPNSLTDQHRTESLLIDLIGDMAVQRRRGFSTKDLADLNEDIFSSPAVVYHDALWKTLQVYEQLRFFGEEKKGKKQKYSRLIENHRKRFLNNDIAATLSELGPNQAQFYYACQYLSGVHAFREFELPYPDDFPDKFEEQYEFIPAEERKQIREAIEQPSFKSLVELEPSGKPAWLKPASMKSLTQQIARPIFDAAWEGAGETGTGLAISAEMLSQKTDVPLFRWITDVPDDVRVEIDNRMKNPVLKRLVVHHLANVVPLQFIYSNKGEDVTVEFYDDTFEALETQVEYGLPTSPFGQYVVIFPPLKKLRQIELVIGLGALAFRANTPIPFNPNLLYNSKRLKGHQGEARNLLSSCISYGAVKLLVQDDQLHPALGLVLDEFVRPKNFVGVPSSEIARYMIWEHISFFRGQLFLRAKDRSVMEAIFRNYEPHLGRQGMIEVEKITEEVYSFLLELDESGVPNWMNQKNFEDTVLYIDKAIRAKFPGPNIPPGALGVSTGGKLGAYFDSKIQEKGIEHVALRVAPWVSNALFHALWIGGWMFIPILVLGPSNISFLISFVFSLIAAWRSRRAYASDRTHPEVHYVEDAYSGYSGRKQSGANEFKELRRRANWEIGFFLFVTALGGYGLTYFYGRGLFLLAIFAGWVVSSYRHYRKNKSVLRKGGILGTPIGVNPYFRWFGSGDDEVNTKIRLAVDGDPDIQVLLSYLREKGFVPYLQYPSETDYISRVDHILGDASDSTLNPGDFIISLSEEIFGQSEDILSSLQNSVEKIGMYVNGNITPEQFYKAKNSNPAHPNYRFYSILVTTLFECELGRFFGENKERNQSAFERLAKRYFARITSEMRNSQSVQADDPFTLGFGYFLNYLRGIFAFRHFGIPMSTDLEEELDDLYQNLSTNQKRKLKEIFNDKNIEMALLRNPDKDQEPFWFDPQHVYDLMEYVARKIITIVTEMDPEGEQAGTSNKGFKFIWEGTNPSADLRNSVEEALATEESVRILLDNHIRLSEPILLVSAPGVKEVRSVYLHSEEEASLLPRMIGRERLPTKRYIILLPPRFVEPPEIIRAVGSVASMEQNKKNPRAFEPFFLRCDLPVDYREEARQFYEAMIDFDVIRFFVQDPRLHPAVIILVDDWFGKRQGQQGLSNREQGRQFFLDLAYYSFLAPLALEGTVILPKLVRFVGHYKKELGKAAAKRAGDHATHIYQNLSLDASEAVPTEWGSPEKFGKAVKELRERVGADFHDGGWYPPKGFSGMATGGWLGSYFDAKIKEEGVEHVAVEVAPWVSNAFFHALWIGGWMFIPILVLGPSNISFLISFVFSLIAAWRSRRAYASERTHPEVHYVEDAESGYSGRRESGSEEFKELRRRANWEIGFFLLVSALVGYPLSGMFGTGLFLHAILLGWVVSSLIHRSKNKSVLEKGGILGVATNGSPYFTWVTIVSRWLQKNVEETVRTNASIRSLFSEYLKDIDSIALIQTSRLTEVQAVFVEDSADAELLEEKYGLADIPVGRYVILLPPREITPHELLRVVACIALIEIGLIPRSFESFLGETTLPDTLHEQARTMYEAMVNFEISALLLSEEKWEEAYFSFMENETANFICSTSNALQENVRNVLLASPLFYTQATNVDPHRYQEMAQAFIDHATFLFDEKNNMKVQVFFISEVASLLEQMPGSYLNIWTNPDDFEVAVATLENLLTQHFPDPLKPHAHLGMATDGLVGRYFNSLIKEGHEIEDLAVGRVPWVSNAFFHALWIGGWMFVPILVLGPSHISFLISFVFSLIAAWRSERAYASERTHPQVHEVLDPKDEEKDIQTKDSGSDEFKELRKRAIIEISIFLLVTTILGYPLAATFGRGMFLLAILAGWVASSLRHRSTNKRALKKGGILGIANVEDPGFRWWGEVPSKEEHERVVRVIEDNKELQELIRYVTDDVDSLLFEIREEGEGWVHYDETVFHLTHPLGLPKRAKFVYFSKETLTDPGSIEKNLVRMIGNLAFVKYKKVTAATMNDLAKVVHIDNREEPAYMEMWQALLKLERLHFYGQWPSDEELIFPDFVSHETALVVKESRMAHLLTLDPAALRRKYVMDHLQGIMALKNAELDIPENYEAVLEKHYVTLIPNEEERANLKGVLHDDELAAGLVMDENDRPGWLDPKIFKSMVEQVEYTVYRVLWGRDDDQALLLFDDSIVDADQESLLEMVKDDQELVLLLQHIQGLGNRIKVDYRHLNENDYLRLSNADDLRQLPEGLTGGDFLIRLASTAFSDLDSTLANIKKFVEHMVLMQRYQISEEDKQRLIFPGIGRDHEKDREHFFNLLMDIEALRFFSQARTPRNHPYRQSVGEIQESPLAYRRMRIEEGDEEGMALAYAYDYFLRIYAFEQCNLDLPDDAEENLDSWYTLTLPTEVRNLIKQGFQDNSDLAIASFLSISPQDGRPNWIGYNNFLQFHNFVNRLASNALTGEATTAIHKIKIVDDSGSTPPPQSHYQWLNTPPMDFLERVENELKMDPDVEEFHPNYLIRDGPITFVYSETIREVQTFIVHEYESAAMLATQLKVSRTDLKYGHAYVVIPRNVDRVADRVLKEMACFRYLELSGFSYELDYFLERWDRQPGYLDYARRLYNALITAETMAMLEVVPDHHPLLLRLQELALHSTPLRPYPRDFAFQYLLDKLSYFSTLYIIPQGMVRPAQLSLQADMIRHYESLWDKMGIERVDEIFEDHVEDLLGVLHEGTSQRNWMDQNNFEQGVLEIFGALEANFQGWWPPPGAEEDGAMFGMATGGWLGDYFNSLIEEGHEVEDLAVGRVPFMSNAYFHAFLIGLPMFLPVIIFGPTNFGFGVSFFFSLIGAWWSRRHYSSDRIHPRVHKVPVPVTGLIETEFAEPEDLDELRGRATVEIFYFLLVSTPLGFLLSVILGRGMFLIAIVLGWFVSSLIHRAKNKSVLEKGGILGMATPEPEFYEWWDANKVPEPHKGWVEEVIEEDGELQRLLLKLKNDGRNPIFIVQPHENTYFVADTPQLVEGSRGRLKEGDYVVALNQEIITSQVDTYIGLRNIIGAAVVNKTHTITSEQTESLEMKDPNPVVVPLTTLLYSSVIQYELLRIFGEDKDEGQNRYPHFSDYLLELIRQVPRNPDFKYRKPIEHRFCYITAYLQGIFAFQQHDLDFPQGFDSEFEDLYSPYIPLKERLTMKATFQLRSLRRLLEMNPATQQPRWVEPKNYAMLITILFQAVITSDQMTPESVLASDESEEEFFEWSNPDNVPEPYKGWVEEVVEEDEELQRLLVMVRNGERKPRFIVEPEDSRLLRAEDEGVVAFSQGRLELGDYTFNLSENDLKSKAGIHQCLRQLIGPAVVKRRYSITYEQMENRKLGIRHPYVAPLVSLLDSALDRYELIRIFGEGKIGENNQYPNFSQYLLDQILQRPQTGDFVRSSPVVHRLNYIVGYLEGVYAFQQNNLDFPQGYENFEETFEHRYGDYIPQDERELMKKAIKAANVDYLLSVDETNRQPRWLQTRIYTHLVTLFLGAAVAGDQETSAQLASKSEPPKIENVFDQPNYQWITDVSPEFKERVGQLLENDPVMKQVLITHRLQLGYPVFLAYLPGTVEVARGRIRVSEEEFERLNLVTGGKAKEMPIYSVVLTPRDDRLSERTLAIIVEIIFQQSRFYHKGFETLIPPETAQWKSSDEFANLFPSREGTLPSSGNFISPPQKQRRPFVPNHSLAVAVHKALVANQIITMVGSDKNMVSAIPRLQKLELEYKAFDDPGTNTRRTARQFILDVVGLADPLQLSLGTLGHLAVPVYEFYSDRLAEPLRDTAMVIRELVFAPMRKRDKSGHPVWLDQTTFDKTVGKFNKELITNFPGGDDDLPQVRGFGMATNKGLVGAINRYFLEKRKWDFEVVALAVAPAVTSFFHHVAVLGGVMVLPFLFFDGLLAFSLSLALVLVVFPIMIYWYASHHTHPEVYKSVPKEKEEDYAPEKIVHRGKTHIVVKEEAQPPDWKALRKGIRRDILFFLGVSFIGYIPALLLNSWWLLPFILAGGLYSAVSHKMRNWDVLQAKEGGVLGMATGGSKIFEWYFPDKYSPSHKEWINGAVQEDKELQRLMSKLKNGERNPFVHVHAQENSFFEVWDQRSVDISDGRLAIGDYVFSLDKRSLTSQAHAQNVFRDVIGPAVVKKIHSITLGQAKAVKIPDPNPQAIPLIDLMESSVYQYELFRIFGEDKDGEKNRYPQFSNYLLGKLSQEPQKPEFKNKESIEHRFNYITAYLQGVFSLQQHGLDFPQDFAREFEDLYSPYIPLKTRETMRAYFQLKSLKKLMDIDPATRQPRWVEPQNYAMLVTILFQAVITSDQMTPEVVLESDESEEEYFEWWNPAEAPEPHKGWVEEVVQEDEEIQRLLVKLRNEGGPPLLVVQPTESNFMVAEDPLILEASSGRLVEGDVVIALDQRALKNKMVTHHVLRDQIGLAAVTKLNSLTNEQKEKLEIPIAEPQVARLIPLVERAVFQYELLRIFGEDKDGDRNRYPNFTHYLLGLLIQRPRSSEFGKLSPMEHRFCYITDYLQGTFALEAHKLDHNGNFSTEFETAYARYIPDEERETIRTHINKHVGEFFERDARTGQPVWTDPGQYRLLHPILSIPVVTSDEITGPESVAAYQPTPDSHGNENMYRWLNVPSADMRSHVERLFKDDPVISRLGEFVRSPIPMAYSEKVTKVELHKVSLENAEDFRDDVMDGAGKVPLGYVIVIPPHDERLADRLLEAAVQIVFVNSPFYEDEFDTLVPHRISPSRQMGNNYLLAVAVQKALVTGRKFFMLATHPELRPAIPRLQKLALDSRTFDEPAPYTRETAKQLILDHVAFADPFYRFTDTQVFTQAWYDLYARENFRPIFDRALTVHQGIFEPLYSATPTRSPSWISQKVFDEVVQEFNKELIMNFPGEDLPQVPGFGMATNKGLVGAIIRYFLEKRKWDFEIVALAVAPAVTSFFHHVAVLGGVMVLPFLFFDGLLAFSLSLALVVVVFPIMIYWYASHHTHPEVYKSVPKEKEEDYAPEKIVHRGKTHIVVKEEAQPPDWKALRKGIRRDILFFIGVSFIGYIPALLLNSWWLVPFILAGGLYSAVSHKMRNWDALQGKEGSVFGMASDEQQDYFQWYEEKSGLPEIEGWVEEVVQEDEELQRMLVTLQNDGRPPIFLIHKTENFQSRIFTEQYVDQLGGDLVVGDFLFMMSEEKMASKHDVLSNLRDLTGLAAVVKRNGFTEEQIMKISFNPPQPLHQLLVKQAQIGASRNDLIRYFREEGGWDVNPYPDYTAALIGEIVGRPQSENFEKRNPLEHRVYYAIDYMQGVFSMNYHDLTHPEGFEKEFEDGYNPYIPVVERNAIKEIFERSEIRKILDVDPRTRQPRWIEPENFKKLCDIVIGNLVNIYAFNLKAASEPASARQHSTREYFEWWEPEKTLDAHEGLVEEAVEEDEELQLLLSSLRNDQRLPIFVSQTSHGFKKIETQESVAVSKDRVAVGDYVFGFPPALLKNRAQAQDSLRRLIGPAVVNKVNSISNEQIEKLILKTKDPNKEQLLPYLYSALVEYELIGIFGDKKDGDRNRFPKFTAYLLENILQRPMKKEFVEGSPLVHRFFYIIGYLQGVYACGEHNLPFPEKVGKFDEVFEGRYSEYLSKEERDRLKAVLHTERVRDLLSIGQNGRSQPKWLRRQNFTKLVAILFDAIDTDEKPVPAGVPHVFSIEEMILLNGSSYLWVSDAPPEFRHRVDTMMEDDSVLAEVARFYRQQLGYPVMLSYKEDLSDVGLGKAIIPPEVLEMIKGKGGDVDIVIPKYSLVLTPRDTKISEKILRGMVMAIFWESDFYSDGIESLVPHERVEWTTSEDFYRIYFSEEGSTQKVGDAVFPRGNLVKPFVANYSLAVEVRNALERGRMFYMMGSHPELHAAIPRLQQLALGSRVIDKARSATRKTAERLILDHVGYVDPFYWFEKNMLRFVVPVYDFYGEHVSETFRDPALALRGRVFDPIYQSDEEGSPLWLNQTTFDETVSEFNKELIMNFPGEDLPQVPGFGMATNKGLVGAIIRYFLEKRKWDFEVVALAVAPAVTSFFHHVAVLGGVMVLPFLFFDGLLAFSLSLALVVVVFPIMIYWYASHHTHPEVYKSVPKEKESKYAQEKIVHRGKKNIVVKEEAQPSDWKALRKGIRRDILFFLGVSFIGYIPALLLNSWWLVPFILAGGLYSAVSHKMRNWDALQAKEGGVLGMATSGAGEFFEWWEMEKDLTPQEQFVEDVIKEDGELQRLLSSLRNGERKPIFVTQLPHGVKKIEDPLNVESSKGRLALGDVLFGLSPPFLKTKEKAHDSLRGLIGQAVVTKVNAIKNHQLDQLVLNTKDSNKEQLVPYLYSALQKYELIRIFAEDKDGSHDRFPNFSTHLLDGILQTPMKKEFVEGDRLVHRFFYLLGYLQGVYAFGQHNLPFPSKYQKFEEIFEGRYSEYIPKEERDDLKAVFQKERVQDILSMGHNGRAQPKWLTRQNYVRLVSILFDAADPGEKPTSKEDTINVEEITLVIRKDSIHAWITNAPTAFRDRIAGMFGDDPIFRAVSRFYYQQLGYPVILIYKNDIPEVKFAKAKIPDEFIQMMEDKLLGDLNHSPIYYVIMVTPNDGNLSDKILRSMLTITYWESEQFHLEQIKTLIPPETVLWKTTERFAHLFPSTEAPLRDAGQLISPHRKRSIPFVPNISLAIEVRDALDRGQMISMIGAHPELHETIPRLQQLALGERTFDKADTRNAAKQMILDYVAYVDPLTLIENMWEFAFPVYNSYRDLLPETIRNSARSVHGNIFVPVYKLDDEGLPRWITQATFDETVRKLNEELIVNFPGRGLPQVPGFGMATNKGLVGAIIRYFLENRKWDFEVVALAVAPAVTSFFHHVAVLGGVMVLPFLFFDGLLAFSLSLALVLVVFPIMIYWYGSYHTHPDVFKSVPKEKEPKYAQEKIVHRGKKNIVVKEEAQPSDWKALRKGIRRDILFFLGVSFIGYIPALLLNSWWLLPFILAGGLYSAVSHKMRNWDALDGDGGGVLGMASNDDP
ncbi:hypothetical protein BVX98_07645, partial [bacterium F11]